MDSVSHLILRTLICYSKMPDAGPSATLCMALQKQERNQRDYGLLEAWRESKIKRHVQMEEKLGHPQERFPFFY